MSQTLKSKIQAFEIIFKEKQLYSSFNHNTAGWYAFARVISGENAAVPAELHFGDKLL
jgi:hypothetical protein